MDTCICMVESLCYSPKTISTLFVNWLYSNTKQKVIFCVIPTKDYFKLKAGIHLIDPSAFFVATDAYEVLGGE